MMLTKEQAATVWCPMVRIGVTPQAGGPSSINDPGTREFSGNCIADKCAMWRWGAIPDPTFQKPANRHPVSPPVTVPRVESVRGYCGLAGMPCGALS